MTQSPNIVAGAYRRACIRLRKEYGTRDWEILSALYGAKKGLTFTGVWREFNDASNPMFNRLNSWFYDSLGRLVSKGYASVEIRGKVGRKWCITTAGIAAINRANALALEILKEMEGQ
jgi:hypothetical protein